MIIISKTALDEKLTEIENIAKNDGESIFYELEKLLPKAPIKSGVDMYKGYVIDQYICPKCGRSVGDEMVMFTYCPSCGQRMQK